MATQPTRSAADWLVGGGEAGELIRSADWTGSPLGPLPSWPASLRTALGLVLESQLPMALLWGRELTLLHNDAYRLVAASGDPAPLGRPAPERWPSTWPSLDPVLAALARGESLCLEVPPGENHGPDGEELCFSPVRDERSAVAGTLVAVREARRAPGLREDSRAKLEAALASMSDAVFISDAAGRLLEFNDAFATFHRFASREECARTLAEDPAFLEVYLPDGTPVPFEDRPVPRALRGETGASVEYRLRRRDSAQSWVGSYSFAPVRDERGGIVGSVVVGRDVTEQRAAEARIRAANERLEEADRRKTDFLAVLSHELRNPLGPIRLGIQLLERAAPGGEQASRAMRVIERQAVHLTRLIDDLLDVTRISRGKVDLKLERVELNALARAAAEDHRDLYARNGVTLEVEAAAEPLHVHGDPTRLTQVLGNLLSNAAKFTPRGGRTVLSLEANEQQGAVIRVRDTGIGLSPESLQHLFEPFMQAPQSIARTRGGLGLGLALIKGLVQMHGGTVSARSGGEGKGTEFAVTLPLEAPVRPTVPAPPARERRPAGRRVLLVEDNRDAADSLREILELDDHEVAVAYSGPEGLDLAHAFKPEVVLCDIGLPGMDGYGVARALRSDPDPQLRSAFLVALSGYALPDDIQNAKEAGFDRHMPKPPRLDRLEKLLAGVPTNEQRRRAGAL